MQNIDFQGMAFTPDLPVSTYSIKDLEVIESRLGFTFPEDYRLFISTLGAGETEFHVRAYPPHDEYLFEASERFLYHWFWDESPEILTQAYAMECVAFFDSTDGDDIIFHPSNPNCWFILPHEEGKVIIVNSFQQLCQHYLLLYDELSEPFQFRVWST
jgi:hypothetical protein